MEEEGEKRRFDEGGETWTMIGCHRETWRLDRVLERYHVALAKAYDAGKFDALRSGLVAVHDHKGIISIVWRTQAAMNDLKPFVDDAWFEIGETETYHVIGNEANAQSIISRKDYM
ncbi:MAG: hypothetical protein AAF197_09225 [Pseudomonadota bacterium]